MLNLSILEDQQKVKTHQDTISRTMQAMEAELAKIDRASLKEEVVSQKERETRQRFEPIIREELKRLNDIEASQRQLAPFWESKEYIASVVPVTKPLAENVPFMPADEAKELAARSALSQEYSRMSPALLSLHFQAAKSRGEIAKCFLINSVNQLKDTPAPFDLSGVEMPHRADVLNVMQATRGARLTAENSWRESMGTRVSGAAKLAAAREMALAVGGE